MKMYTRPSEPPFPTPVPHLITSTLSFILLPPLQTLLPVAVCLVAVVAADSEADSDPAPSPLATYAPSYYSFDHYADQGGGLASILYQYIKNVGNFKFVHLMGLICGALFLELLDRKVT